jgi:hypothetical protein
MVRLLPPSNGANTPQPSFSSNSSTSTSGAPSPEYEVREVRLLQNVVFHQDPEEGKTRGNDASGQALYVFNEGENKVRMVIFNDLPKNVISKEGVSELAGSDPDKTRDRPQLPPAKISTDEMQITGPLIGMDQTKDLAWVNGPGTLMQIVDRGMMADTNPVDTPGSADPAEPKRSVEANKTGDGKDQPKKLLTRAGRTLSEKTVLTIAWTDSMRFYGRSPDFENHPDSAARAEFYGHVNAITEEKDSMLDCQEKMITYTDRPVPLTRMSKGAGVGSGAPRSAGEPQAPEPKPDLAVIEMFGNAVAVNRKVDPDRPIVLQKQRIQTDHLVYDRRTGNFSAPGEGIVYLYDREKQGANGAPSGGLGSNMRITVDGRTVIPTSMQVPGDDGIGYPPPAEMEPEVDTSNEEDVPQQLEPKNAARRPVAHSSTGTRGSRRSTAPRVAGTIRSETRPGKPRGNPSNSTNTVPPLILTQIKYSKEMRGRFGTSNKEGASETRVAEFFGGVEVIRTPVNDEFGTVERKQWTYRPPRDVYYMTAETLHVMTEPPPPGSPKDAPARHWLKAWEDGLISTNDKALQADIITYNSTNDLFHAYGEDGHQVTITQQTGSGQPGSVSRQQAVQYHPKTGAVQSINPQQMEFIDVRTGARPKIQAAPNPDAKPKKKVKPPIKPRIPPMERKGFTGR